MNALPPELFTLLLSMLPLTELRAALPIAFTTLRLSLFEAFFWSVLGNIIPVLVVSPFLPQLTRLFHRVSPYTDRLLRWCYEKVQKKMRGRETIEGLALALFVAIPLPGTGAWTAMLITFLLGLPLRRSIPFTILGVIGAGIIVSLITGGIASSWAWMIGG